MMSITINLDLKNKEVVFQSSNSTRFGRNLVCHNPMRIGANTKAKKKKNIKKKWHGCVSAALPRQCVSGAGAAAPALHPCFLVAPTTILRNKTFNLS